MMWDAAALTYIALTGLMFSVPLFFKTREVRLKPYTLLMCLILSTWAGVLISVALVP